MDNYSQEQTNFTSLQYSQMTDWAIQMIEQGKREQLIYYLKLLNKGVQFNRLSEEQLHEIKEIASCESLTKRRLYSQFQSELAQAVKKFNRSMVQTQFKDYHEMFDNLTTHLMKSTLTLHRFVYFSQGAGLLYSALTQWSEFQEIAIQFKKVFTLAKEKEDQKDQIITLLKNQLQLNQRASQRVLLHKRQVQAEKNRRASEEKGVERRRNERKSESKKIDENKKITTAVLRASMKKFVGIK